MIIDTIEDDAEPQEALDDSEKFLPETLESEPNGESISLERLLSARIILYHPDFISLNTEDSTSTLKVEDTLSTEGSNKMTPSKRSKRSCDDAELYEETSDSSSDSGMHLPQKHPNDN